jgi:tetratricopeptide (TPR) repeat protein
MPMPLEDEDQRHLTAAYGYMELGMPLEANAELERIDAYVRHVPEVLAVRVEIYRTLERWELMQTVARKLAECDPSSSKWVLALTFALRRSDSIAAARDVLMQALERFPAVAAIHYNLACLDCVLRNVDAAKERLQRAFELDATLRLQALEDRDLESLWSGLK